MTRLLAIALVSLAGLASLQGVAHAQDAPVPRRHRVESVELGPSENFRLEGHLVTSIALMGIGAALAGGGFLAFELDDPPPTSGWPTFSPSPVAVLGAVMVLGGALVAAVGAIWLIVALAAHRTYEPQQAGIELDVGASPEGGWVGARGRF